jgi:hypothetical protein
LLVVIAVSVLVITVLGTLAKQSLRLGLQAADAERSLQQRWGALTLERSVLGQASRVFELQDEKWRELGNEGPPPATIRDALTLGGVTFDLMLGDEDAKLNLNMLFHRVGASKTEDAIREMGGPSAALVLRLLPATKALQIDREQRRTRLQSQEPEEEPVIPDPFRSWGEVFDLEALERSTGTDVALPSLTTGMTCWGAGQLNIRRASDEAILAVAGSIVQDGGAQRILQRYRQSKTISLEILLTSEVSNRRDQDSLKRMLSETSTNFSLWLDASTKAHGSIRTFSVMRRDEEGVTRNNKFLH